MRLKIIIGLFGIGVLTIIGIPTAIQCREQMGTIAENEETIETGTSVYEDLKQQSSALLSQVESEGKGVALDNLTVANELASFSGVTISNITAVGENEGVVGPILTTTDITDLTFLGSDVTEIKYDIAYEDISSLMQDISETGIVVEDLVIDASNKSASITVPSVAGVYGIGGEADGASLDYSVDGTETTYTVEESEAIE